MYYQWLTNQNNVDFCLSYLPILKNILKIEKLFGKKETTIYIHKYVGTPT